MNGKMMKPMDRTNVPKRRRLTAHVRCEVVFLSFFIFCMSFIYFSSYYYVSCFCHISLVFYFCDIMCDILDNIAISADIFEGYQH